MLSKMGSLKWVVVSCALAQMDTLYPFGTGPSTVNASHNVFLLPFNYLRKAPQDPKAGSQSYLGAPSGLTYDDWLYEDNFIISDDPTILLRFGADVSDVSKFDPAFSEMLAARIALAVVVPLTQSDSRTARIEGQYNKWAGECRLTNGVEQGAEEPPVDDWIACRV